MKSEYITSGSVFIIMCHQTQSLAGIEEYENCSCYGEWRTVYFTIITDLTYVFM